MSKLYIKIIVGFRADQQYTVDATEAHKAYYLFLNPSERGVFNNGLALIGSAIKSIEPDYNATMGWNADHVIDGDDWNDMKSKSIDRELRDIMYLAKSVAQSGEQDKLAMPLSETKLLS